jgi:hypothetical protein
VCERASVVKGALPASSPILVSTGGGGDFNDSLAEAYFNCVDVDLVSIHTRSSDFNHIQSGVYLASNLTHRYNKQKSTLLEFGVPSSSGSQALLLSKTAKLANFYSIPWMM